MLLHMTYFKGDCVPTDFKDACSDQKQTNKKTKTTHGWIGKSVYFATDY